MGTKPQALPEHNYVAVFSAMEAAGDALLALERAGVDGSKISVLGRGVDEAEEKLDTTDRDAHILEYVGKRVAAGAGAGAGAGGLAGLAAGAAAFAIPGVGPVIGAGLLASAIGGALAGGAIGGAVASYSGLPVGQASELTYEAVRQGQVVIAVHSDDADEIVKAEGVLRDEKPLSAGRFDSKGNPMPDTDQ